MCGQAGILFGTKDRNPKEREHLARIFTRLLVLNEERGPFATGIALINRDGSYQVSKEPLPAHELVQEKACQNILSSITDEATALLGHTRWPTNGSVMNPANNHPLLANRIWGTHNGHIANADALFKRFNFPRTGQVDSEIIFRMADDTIDEDNKINIADLLHSLSLCQGQMSAVILTLTDPETIILAKGNKPLELRYHGEYHAIAYASNSSYLDHALATDPGWIAIPTIPMTFMVFRCSQLPHYACEPLCLANSWRRYSLR